MKTSSYLLACTVILTGCTSVTETVYTPYQPFNYYKSIHDYPQSDNIYMYSDGVTYESKAVTVPESYHVGADHSPVSHKERDKTWVSSQNPDAYTIQIGSDTKASRIANKLNQAPKNERMAEIKYYQDGKPYYKGLYGTYKTKEEAKKALENLPDSLKKDAGIQTFGTVQNTADN